MRRKTHPHWFSLSRRPLWKEHRQATGAFQERRKRTYASRKFPRDARAEQAERRWDARVGRAMDVALPHELNPKAQWDLLRGFGLQLRDEYGAAVCVSLHHPDTKGDQRNTRGHIFMTSRAVDEDGDFAKTKIRSLDDRKLGPVEVERIREMWEVRCNRALRKAGLSEDVTRHSLKAQGIDRSATQHLGPKAFEPGKRVG